MSGNTTTFALTLLVLLAASVCFALPEASVAVEETAATGEVSTWSDFLAPVGDFWSANMGYNVRGRAQQVGLDDEDDQDDARVYTTRRAGENGGGVCNPNATTVCSGRGWCTDDLCVCREGWTGYQCHHERKSKLTAFLLEFFIGASTGASSFYLGYIGQGVGKILLTWVPCILACFGSCLIGAGKESSTLKALGGLLTSIPPVCYLAVCIWSLVDWIMILLDDLDDYDGYYLMGF